MYKITESDDKDCSHVADRNRKFREHEAYLVNEAKEFLQALRYHGIFPNPWEVEGELPRDEATGHIDFLKIFMEVLRGKGWWDEEQDEDEKYFLSIPKRSYYLGGNSDRFEILQYF